MSVIRRKSIYDKIWAGDYFEGVLVLEKLYYLDVNQYAALFKCHCGKTFERLFGNVKRGQTTCRDCSNYERNKSKYVIKDRRLYRIWKAMNNRCHNNKDPNYDHYGGRGIFVCEDWRDTSEEGFTRFYQQVGIYPTTNHTLERLNVNRGYNPDNCMWASYKEQANNKRDNHYIEWKGETYTIQLLAEQLGIKPNTLLYRLRRGWSIDEAVKGKRKEVWKRPLNKLTDEQFDKLLIRFFKHKEVCYRLSKEYGLDSGNLHRVLHREDVITYYKDNLSERL